jgi:uncharacterized protein YhaN
VETKRQALADHEAAGLALQERWRALWQPCGFAPLEPDAMAVWLENQHALGGAVQQCQQLTEEAQSLSSRRAAYEARLRQALSDTEGDVPTLLAAARARLETARGREQARHRLEKDKWRLTELRVSLERDRQRHQKLAQEWQARWREVLARLRLPRQWQPALAQSVLARLSTARVHLTTAADLEARVASMSRRLEEFDPAVRQLCQAAAPDLADTLPEIAAAKLQERLAQALAVQTRCATLQRGLADKRGKLRDLDRRLADAQTHLQALLRRAEVENDDEFLRVAERADCIAALDRDLVAKERELGLIRANEEPADFAVRLAQADLDLSRERLRELDACLEKARLDKTAADEHVGSCRAALAELERGSGEAAALQEQAAAKRAQLAASVDRYVPLVLAQHVLRKAMERFEQQAQPAMLQDVTRIFQTMTDGGYVRVERPLADDQPLVVYRDTGEPLEPSQLSTGTREQLYLAIRLAYVLHYCSQAEPLPIVMDDVLANFDDDRARRTLQALGEVAERVQVILFTCHPHVVGLARDVFPSLRPIVIRTGAELINYRA